jgi:putative ATP-dependent endonuclease of OLD family
MLASAARGLGASNSSAALEDGYKRWTAGGLSTAEKKELGADMRNLVLKTARRIGKARFAQVASSFVTPECAVPKYIESALDWLTDDQPDQ